MSVPSIYMVGGHVIGSGGGIFATSSGGGGGNQFFVDAFPTYTQFYVSTVGNDSWDGTSPTFVSGTIGPKLTPQAGLNVALASVNSTGIGACCNVLSGTYSVSTNISVGATTGTSPTAQLVIRGLPSYTSSQLPQIVFAPNAGFYLNVNSNAVSNVTFWKLDISSTSSSSSPSGVGLITFLSQSAVTNLHVMYSRLHGIYGGDLACCLNVQGPNSTGLLVQYCYFFNSGSTDGSGSDNAALILDYHVPAAIVDRCDFTAPAGCAIYVKSCAPQTANNGWIITNNRFHGLTNDSIYFAEQGAGDPDGFFDSVVTGNLFDNVFQAIRQNNTQNTLQSSRFLVANNTFTNTVQNAIAFAAMTAININSNVLMATTQILGLVNPSPFVNGISNCNNNAILTSTGQSWNMNQFGSGAQNFTSLSTWQTAFSVSGRSELTTNPDVNSVGFVTASINTDFPNNSSGDWTVDPSAPFYATGAGGTIPGYTNSSCGTGW
jgi:hypothetical protein